MIDVFQFDKGLNGCWGRWRAGCAALAGLTVWMGSAFFGVVGITFGDPSLKHNCR